MLFPFFLEEKAQRSRIVKILNAESTEGYILDVHFVKSVVAAVAVVSIIFFFKRLNSLDILSHKE